MRYHYYFLPLVGILFCFLSVICVWASWKVEQDERELLPARREFVRSMHLTDLAVWTEARYTRHPSQADLFTPFQEFPGVAEHFPAGSLMAPPPFDLKTQIHVNP